MFLWVKLTLYPKDLRPVCPKFVASNYLHAVTILARAIKFGDLSQPVKEF